MITEDRVMTIFVEANPAPDVDALELVEVGSAAYLATLEQRSSEVTQLETQKPPEEDQKRSWTPWLVAAVAILVLGVALIIITQLPAETPPATDPSPTTLVESTPTTLAEQTPTTVSDTSPTTITEAAVDPLEGEWDMGGTTIRFEGDLTGDGRTQYTILQAGVGTDWGTWSRPFLPEYEFAIMLVSSSDTEVCSEGDEAIVDYGFDSGPDILEIAVGDDACGDRGLGSVPTVGPQPVVQYSRLGTATTGDSDWDSTPVFVSPQSLAVIEPGDYRTGRFEVPFRFALTDGWVSFVPEWVNGLSLSTDDGPELNMVFKLFEETTVDACCRLVRLETRAEDDATGSDHRRRGGRLDLRPRSAGDRHCVQRRKWHIQ